ncbi:kinase-like domain-containing protein [Elsinoe ampelina]|uniref:Kinase-like domain-containing protein n=1 Tax=Elsinoe ampelina TaxID=302913 RepID=A0A6A6GNX4_9PEZI|nr:kinase-like domain-containing protein [Elsinoe ampelina]
MAVEEPFANRASCSSRTAPTTSSGHVIPALVVLGRPSWEGALDRNAFSLLLEHLDGLDLSRHVDSKGYCNADPERVHTMVDEMPDVIKYPVKHGIEHNDIKPANIIIGPNSIKLTDFGLSAKGHQKGPYHGGTPGYVPLEILQNRDPLLYPDHRDIFALTYTFLFALGWRKDPEHPPYDVLSLGSSGPEGEKLLKFVQDGWNEAENLAIFNIPLQDAFEIEAKDRMSPEELCEAVKSIRVSNIKKAQAMAATIRVTVAASGDD